MLIWINGGYFPAICRVCFKILQESCKTMLRFVFLQDSSRSRMIISPRSYLILRFILETESFGSVNNWILNWKSISIETNIVFYQSITWKADIVLRAICFKLFIVLNFSPFLFVTIPFHRVSYRRPRVWYHRPRVWYRGPRVSNSWTEQNWITEQNRQLPWKTRMRYELFESVHIATLCSCWFIWNVNKRET